MRNGFLGAWMSQGTLLVAFFLALLFATVAEAVDDDRERLEKRVDQLESDIQRLSQVPIPPTPIQPCVGCFDTYTDPRKAAFPTVALGGFFQADWGWFNQDAVNIATVGDIQDGADFRRARLNAHGDVWDNVGYMAEFDFAFPGRPNFMDVYMDIRELPLLGNLRIGQWRQPFGMDGQTSVKEITFLERALPFAFLPFRQIGAGFQNHTKDEDLTWAASVFRFPTDAFGGNVGDNGGYALAMRVTALPWYSADETQLLHLGVGYSFGDPANDRVRYRNQPEFFVSETGGADLVPAGVPTSVPLFVDTGAISTTNFNLFSAEGGLVLGSLYLQSEAIYALVNQMGGPDLTFSGAYAQAGYFLTGEVRPYNRKAGVFGRVKPLDNFNSHGGRGAWELASRWSYIDLNDKNIAGGRLNDVTLGINWYLNPRTKFQFNYIHAFLDSPTFGDSDADIFAWRGQVDF